MTVILGLDGLTLKGDWLMVISRHVSKRHGSLLHQNPSLLLVLNVRGLKIVPNVSTLHSKGGSIEHNILLSGVFIFIIHLILLQRPLKNTKLRYSVSRGSICTL